ncbi:MAG: hypothetical protein JSU65_14690 [Candidatus Zixiibacteriota bacterium]|nr:MAG: hypothetical protein JSU65_14690 [candidate division Zixibacteria bacterium]
MIKYLLGVASIVLCVVMLGCSDKSTESPRGPIITLSQTSLEFSANAGGDNPPTQRVIVTNSGTGDLETRVTSPAAWIDVTAWPVGNPDTIRVAVYTHAVPSGVNVDSIEVASSGALNTPQYIRVTFTVSETIAVDPGFLAFSWVSGAAVPDSQFFRVITLGGDSLDYSISKSADWLSLSKTSGKAEDTIYVSVDPVGQASGVYTDTVVISSPEAVNDSAIIPITLAVSSWVPSNTNIPNQVTLQGLTFLSSDIVWTVGSILSFADHKGRAYRSADGGLTWEEKLTVDGTEFGGMAFSSDLVAVVVGDTTLIMRTDDGGETWVEIDPIPIDTTTALWTVAFASPDSAWAVGPSAAIIRSIDAGLSWQNLDHPCSTATCSTMAAIAYADNNNIWLAGNHGGILHSSDGGETWTEQETPTTTDLRGIAFLDLNNGWACGANGTLLRTVDGGATWLENGEPQSTADFYDVYFFTTSLGWIVGTQGTIYHTSNGGNSWIRQYLPDPENNRPWLFEVEFFHGDTGLVVGDSGRVFRTISGGF